MTTALSERGAHHGHRSSPLYRARVDNALAFYRDRLGFHEDMHPSPVVAMRTRGDLRLVLSAPSGPNTGGGSVLADGRRPEPGGWNRFTV